jgi:hypothetical protein
MFILHFYLRSIYKFLSKNGLKCTFQRLLKDQNTLKKYFILNNQLVIFF